MSKSPTIHLLGLGCAAVDDVSLVESWPRAGEKVPVLSRFRRPGGTTATALAAAAAFGCRASYAGVLGMCAESEYLCGQWAAAGVDLSGLTRREGAGPIHATVLVESTEGRAGEWRFDAGERTVLYDLSRALVGEDVEPPVELIERSRVLLVDSLGVPRMIRAAEAARRAAVPVVADFESDAHPRFGELLALVDHLVIPQDFARHLAQTQSAEAACHTLARQRPWTVVVTCGAEGSWSADGGKASPPRHHSACPVKVRDTTGCGDVFHGVYAAALSQPDLAAGPIAYATFAAALWASRDGGWEQLPTREEVQQFILTDPWTAKSRRG